MIYLIVWNDWQEYKHNIPPSQQDQQRQQWQRPLQALWTKYCLWNISLVSVSHHYRLLSLLWVDHMNKLLTYEHWKLSCRYKSRFIETALLRSSIQELSFLLFSNSINRFCISIFLLFLSIMNLYNLKFFITLPSIHPLVKIVWMPCQKNSKCSCENIISLNIPRIIVLPILKRLC